MANLDYALVDSGAGRKLERFAEKLLIRPSSLAIWQPRKPSEWNNADAEFVHGEGWHGRAADEAPWHIKVAETNLVLRLQRNGQIGIFPEHISYLLGLRDAATKVQSDKGRPAKVLNLFAYTGMATTVLAKMGAEVTHVDILRTTLDWTKENLAANQIPDGRVRLIPEDAITFLEREARRNNLYDIIIADPPSFSRVSKTKSWNLDDILIDLISKVVALVEKDSAHIYLTSHETAHGDIVTKNVLLDLLPGKFRISASQLNIKELESPRELPAGFLCVADS